MKKLSYFFSTLSKQQVLFAFLLFITIYYWFGLVFSIMYAGLYLANSYLKNRKINFRKGTYFQR